MNTINYFLLFIVIILFSCHNNNKSSPPGETPEFLSTEGYALGTSYHIKYENTNKTDLSKDIAELLDGFENSLSTFRPNSIISLINQNNTSVIPDKYFTECFNKAQEVSEKVNGAFDITVAPLVNIWGFGFTEKTEVDESKIQDLLKYVGYKKIRLENNKIIKDDPSVMLDASAIAKGQSVDVVCEFFDSLGIVNYMVEIGGEVRAKGYKQNSQNWIIGIDKPIDNSDETYRELEAMVKLENMALATSGNYRRFYEIGGIRYSHTINPSTGYPVNHTLLSATVLSKDCITADAYATAFMVLGLDESLKIVNNNPDIEAYFISAGNDNNYKVDYSEGFKKLLLE
ncbi:MAG: FAD:protein FMN transferase [Bacteroidota bacterium]